MTGSREDIEFDAEGVTLRGWFFPAAGAPPEAPCVVMAHGWGATKEMHLDDFAEVFSAAGLAVVVFDNRGWGASGVAAGKPRHEIDPWEQIRDFQHAITYAQTRPEVDEARIGAWAPAYSGGHIYVLGATDRRIKAVVAHTPMVSGRRLLEAVLGVDMINPTLELRLGQVAKS